MQNQNLRFLPSLFFLLGFACGSMMVRLQLTDAAQQATGLLQKRLEAFPMSIVDFDEGAVFAGTLLFPAMLLLIGVFCFGLWMVGQPFVVALFAIAGFFGGSYGMLLLQNGESLFLLLWYLPFLLIGFYILLILGGVAIGFGNHLLCGLKRPFQDYLIVGIRQAVFLVILCVLAAFGYYLYGSTLCSG